MRTAVDQLPLFCRLPMPKKPPPEPPRWWLPRSWDRAVRKLWKLPRPLLALVQPELPLTQRRKPQNRVKFSIDPKTLPYSVKPSRIIWMIQTAPPPKPLCFDSDRQWAEYLMLLHAEGQQITRRQDTGKWKTVGGQKVRTARTTITVLDEKRIDFCQDCTVQRRHQMQDEKRCIATK